MSTVPRVYLARHGETEWSKSGQHTGLTDIPLTAKGEADAVRIGTRLTGIPFTRVFCSPLQRASRTGMLAGFNPEPDPELVEWNYGDYEGLTTAQIRGRRPDWELFTHGCPNGESPTDIAARADRVAARLKALTGNLLVFAHGHILRVLAARWVGEPVAFGRALLLSTATVSILGFDHQVLNEPAIVLWNDDRHLQ